MPSSSAYATLIIITTMNKCDISDEQTLDNAGVRVTAVRLLVWRQVRHGFNDAFSLQTY